MPGRITLHALLTGGFLLIASLIFAQVGGMNPDAVPFPTQNCDIVIDTLVIHPTCPGADDGRIEIIVDDSVPQATVFYHWFNAPAQPIDGPSVENLPEGVYACELTDMSGCLDTLVFHLFDPTPIQAIQNSVTLCSGQNTIPLLNSVSGGTPPYTYTYQSQNQINCLNCPNSNVTLDQSDVFTILITDTNGCTSTENVFITVLPPLQIMATTEPETCGADGEISLTATGGASNYSFSLDDDPLTTANTFSNLPAGEYMVMVEDDMGCTTSQSVMVSTTAVFSDFTASVVNVECFGEMTGAIQGVDNNGTISAFSLNDIDFTAPAGAYDNLGAGLYTLYAEDVNGCVTSQEFEILQPDELIVNLVGQDVTCPFGNDGSVFIQTGGGVPGAGYEYSINGDNFQPDANFENLSSGIYEFTVKDANGCEKVETIIIEEPPEPIIQLSKQDVTCPGGNDASIVIVVSGGGVQNDTYEFSLDGNQYQLENNFDGLQSGAYTAYIQNQNGCVTTENFLITEPTAPVIQVNKQGPSCPLLNDASIVIVVSGGGLNDSYEYSLNGIEFQADNQFDDLFAGIYTTYIQNQNGCVTTENFIIEDPPTPDINFNNIDATCNNEPDAQIVIVVSGGGATQYSYSIDGINFQDSNIFQGIAAGAYPVFVQSLDGCSFFDITSVSEPDEPDIQINKQDVSCPGGNDASIVIVVSGGGATNDTYEYSLDGSNFQLSNTFAGLNAGLYTAYVQNQVGCITTQQIIIQEPAIPNINLIPTMVTCPGGNNASIVIVVSGGGLYEYSLDGTNYQPSNAFNDLGSGMYQVFVRNEHACVFTNNIFIEEPEAPTINVNVTDPDCPFENNASIVIVVSGGGLSDTYEYSLTGGTYQPGNTFGGLGAGSYTAFIQNQNGCVSTQFFNIQDPPVPDLDVITQDVTCPGGNDGSIVIVVSGGGLYEYSLDGNNYQSSNTFSGLSSGLYNVFARDNNDCVTAEVTLISSPNAPQVDVIVTPISCPAENDASIVIVVSGGGVSDSYEYSLDGSNYQASNTFSQLSSGVYTSYVQNQDGCVTTQGFSIDIIAAPIISFSISDITCPGGADGSIVAIVAGGAFPPFEFSLDGTNYQPANSFSDLITGLYTVYVRDASGCVFANNAFVDEPPLPTINTQVTDASCAGSTDAIIVVSVSGGVPSDIYEYSLDGIVYQSSNAFPGLAAGLYTVVIKNQDDCVSLTFAIVQEPPEVIITPSVTGVSCEGEFDGAITVLANGGSGSFEYSLDGINFQLANSFNGLGTGLYEVFVQDNGICTSSTLVSINEPPAPLINASTQDLSCPSGGDGIIMISVSGGIGPFQFSLDDTNYQSGNTFSGLNSGVYDVFVSDNNGCSYITVAQLSEPLPFNLSFTNQNATCSINNGLAVCNASGATAPYNYLWANGQTSSIATGLGQGYYGITVTDANNCTWADSTLILNEDGPDANATVIDVSCFGFSDGAIFLEMISGTPPFTYTWSGGITTEDISGLPAGNYKVTILDANNCLNLLEYVISTPDSIEINSSQWIENDLGQIDLTVTGGSPGYSYIWSNGSIEEDQSDLEEGSYTVTVTDFHGCTETAVFDILITDTDDPIVENDVSIFPNPATNSIWIRADLPGNDEVHIDMFGVDGKLIVREKEIGSGNIDFELNIEHFPAGVYFVRLSFKDQNLVRKIIKQ